MFKILFPVVLFIGSFAVLSEGQVRNPRVPRADRPVQGQQERNPRNLGRNTFDRLDWNNDGYISRFEWRGNARGFDRLDRNNDGRISRREWRNRRRNS